jgi:hypothetical protein
MLAYMLLRSALLATVQAPEARYTIECFPMLFALGGIALWAGLRRLQGLQKIKRCQRTLKDRRERVEAPFRSENPPQKA